jgi:hypothetical protein
VQLFAEVESCRVGELAGTSSRGPGGGLYISLKGTPTAGITQASQRQSVH